MYDQDTIDLVDQLLLVLTADPKAHEKIIHASEFDEILDKVTGQVSNPGGGFLARWLWSMDQRKKLFDYLQHLGYEVIDDPVLPFTSYAIQGMSRNRLREHRAEAEASL